jgi:hypothetical protein
MQSEARAASNDGLFSIQRYNARQLWGFIWHKARTCRAALRDFELDLRDGEVTRPVLMERRLFSPVGAQRLPELSSPYCSFNVQR